MNRVDSAIARELDDLQRVWIYQRIARACERQTNIIQVSTARRDMRQVQASDRGDRGIDAFRRVDWPGCATRC